MSEMKVNGLKHRVRAGLLALLFLFVSAVWAEPMNAPSLEEAVRQSDRIVMATYVDYTTPRPVEYFSVPVARYTVDWVMKGPAMAKGTKLQIAYAFQDGSACLAPPDWKFSPKRDMPAPGSRWVLFLMPNESASQKVYATYRGDFGRWAANPNEMRYYLQILHVLQKAK